jgi:GNAT superfamily N-acetyltransferase
METLRDRTRVLIRPLEKTDKQAERDFIQALSSESRRFRFLGSVQNPSERLLDQLTNIDQAHEVAFVAVVPDDSKQQIIGVSRYSADAHGGTCECAVTVADEWHDRGLGTALMRHLIEVARSRGIRSMFSVDSAENLDMRDLARFLGFSSETDPQDATQVIHRLDLDGTSP